MASSNRARGNQNQDRRVHKARNGRFKTNFKNHSEPTYNYERYLCLTVVLVAVLGGYFCFYYDNEGISHGLTVSQILSLTVESCEELMSQEYEVRPIYFFNNCANHILKV